MSVKTLATRKPAFGLVSKFDDFFEPWNEWFKEGFPVHSITLPCVNISEDKTSYNLELAAPGLEKKDFKIEMNGNLLTISAEREDKKEEKEEKYTRKEYNYTSFSRSFTLPEEVLQDKIDATYAEGILKLTLPKDGKAAQKKNREIVVK